MAEAKMPTNDPSEDLRKMFPGNSNKDRENRKKKLEIETEVLDPVVSEGAAKRRPKSMSHRIRDTFINEETRGILSYIWNDVLVPAAKDMLYESITGGLSMRLFGDSRGYSRPVSRRNYTNYNKAHSNVRAVPKQTQQLRPVSRFNSYDISLPTKLEAYEVLDRLCAVIERKGFVTVNDLCQFLQWKSEYTDTYMGWTNLDNVRIRPYQNEWLLELHPAAPIDEIPF